MSKKFGINTKSADARARKDAVKEANDRDKKQKLENEYWRDDDKQDDRDQKGHEKLQHKQENQFDGNKQKLLEQHQSSYTYVDSHPGERMKSAYEAFKNENLPKLKQEHPTLRLSQLLERQRMKSCDNPLNKAIN